MALHTIAISGLNKNAGKTVALNYLVGQAGDQQIVAMTSIGYDGERFDRLYHHSKPLIDVFPGMLVATAAQILKASCLDKRIIAATGLYTPLGEVYIAEILQPGKIELVGPATLQGLLTLKKMLVNQADLFLVDGAFDRWTQIDAQLADAVVLAIGGKESLEQLLAEFRFQYQLWQIPLVPEPMREMATHIINKGQWGIMKGDQSTITLKEVLQGDYRDDFVVGQGAITATLLQQLMRHTKGLIVRGLINLFLTPQLWQAVQKSSYPIYVLDKAVLQTIVINPTKAGIYAIPIEELGRQISQIALDIPVLDVVSGLKFKNGGCAHANEN